MLLNIIAQSTGHICEVQISLKPLLAIKMSSGHVCYEVVTFSLWGKSQIILGCSWCLDFNCLFFLFFFFYSAGEDSGTVSNRCVHVRWRFEPARP